MPSEHVAKDSKDSSKRQERAPHGESEALQSEIPSVDLTATNILKLQRTIGNQAVQRLVAGSKPAGVPAGTIQRDGPPASPAATSTTTASPTANAPAVKARFGPYAPETYGNLLNISSTLVHDVQSQLQDVPADAQVRAHAESWIQGVQAWMPAMEARADAPIDTFGAGQASVFYDELVQLRSELDTYKVAETKAKLEEARAAVSAAATQMADKRADLDDAMRAAFLKQDDNLIATIANITQTSLDIGLGLGELSRDIAKAIGDLNGMTIPAASAYTEWLTKINKVLSAALLIYSTTQTEAPTELNTALNRVDWLAGAFSAGTTLLSVAPHIGLYANLYLVPLTHAIVVRLNAILDKHLHELTSVTAATGGTFSPAELWNEPGGWPVFKFMVNAMAASDAEGISYPIPELVEKYMLKMRDEMNAGTQSDMPTTGWWFWRKTDPAKIKQWVFDHRRQMWAMLYGSMQVPDPSKLKEN